MRYWYYTYFAITIAVVIAVVFVVLAAPTVLAHEGHLHEDEVAGATGLAREARMRNITWDVLWYGSVIMGVLVALSVMWEAGRGIIPESAKKILFGGLIVVTSAVSVYFVASTIYINAVSETGGPVHWHADFRIFSCGGELDIVDPEGLSNKVGNPVVHEHADNRIHVEGVLLEKEAASLGAFFDTVGGRLTSDHVVLPTNNGTVDVRTGDRCSDGQSGVLQVFLWETKQENETAVARQRRLDDPARYVVSSESLIPPGDCIIIAFGQEQERTDLICQQYEVAESKGELRIVR